MVEGTRRGAVRSDVRAIGALSLLQGAIILAIVLFGILAVVQHSSYRRRLKEGTTEAKVAVHIHCGQDKAELLLGFLSAIHHPSFVYLIHVDSRVPQEWETRIVAEVEGNPNYGNVYLATPDLVSPVGISAVLNTLSGFSDLLQLSSTWTHVINLTPEYYPTLEMDELAAVLGEVLRPGESYLGVAEPTNKTDIAELVGYIHFDFALARRTGEITRGVPRIDEPHPFRHERGYALARADPNMILAREFVYRLLTDSVARRMLLSFTNAIWPSELYFATYVVNDRESAAAVVPMNFFHTAVRDADGRLMQVAMSSLNETEYVSAMSQGCLFMGKFHRPVSRAVRRAANRLGRGKRRAMIEEIVASNRDMAVEFWTQLMKRAGPVWLQQ